MNLELFIVSNNTTKCCGKCFVFLVIQLQCNNVVSAILSSAKVRNFTTRSAIVDKESHGSKDVMADGRDDPIAYLNLHPSLVRSIGKEWMNK